METTQLPDRPQQPLHEYLRTHPQLWLPEAKEQPFFTNDDAYDEGWETFAAVAFHVGQARGSDGVIYNLETDMRAFEGEFVAEDGSRRHGTFGFV